jgi:putative flavoprotein involved in K+ transport
MANIAKSHSAKEFSFYLDYFYKRFEIPILFNCEMLSVEKSGDYFNVATTTKILKANYVIDCRGYFSFPTLPQFERRGNTPTLLHFKDFKNENQLHDKKNILIVGKRLSAGQILSEMSTKDHKIFLSKRSDLKYSLPKSALKIFLTFLPLIETITSFFKLNKKYKLEIHMNFELKSIIENQVTLVGNIKFIHDNTVTFDDNQTHHIDAIIFATGFHRPKLTLINDFEDSYLQNYFYLGIEAQRTFKSRFLRGIREDAKVLAYLIFDRLKSK